MSKKVIMTGEFSFKFKHSEVGNIKEIIPEDKVIEAFGRDLKEFLESELDEIEITSGTMKFEYEDI